jgi:hypothetical protein
MELCRRQTERDRRKVLEQAAGGLIGTDQGAARLRLSRRPHRRRGHSGTGGENQGEPHGRGAEAIHRIVKRSFAGRKDSLIRE